ncbi:TPA_asm: hypothetical protein GIM32_13590 [Listeria monocytogenes]|nr:hypothetical protein [Listeria monocytogenes]
MGKKKYRIKLTVAYFAWQFSNFCRTPATYIYPRSEDDYKNKSYIESALHFSFIKNTRGGTGRRSAG